MAIKPLKSIKFPGLPDTYTIEGLSGNAKQALLACFQHVAWIDEHGQNYYNALKRALNIDPSLVYEIGSGTDLSNRTFDTGVNAFSIEQDFTVLAKITLFPDTSEPSSTTRMKMLVTNGSIGNKNVFRLAIDVKEGLNYYVTNYMYGDSYASITGQYANVQHELIWVCRNENAQFRKVLYVDGTLALDKEEDMTLKTTGTVSGTYVIGSSPISAEVWVFNIYNIALDYSDINAILGIDLQD